MNSIEFTKANNIVKQQAILICAENYKNITISILTDRILKYLSVLFDQAKESVLKISNDPKVVKNATYNKFQKWCIQIKKWSVGELEEEVIKVSEDYASKFEDNEGSDIKFLFSRTIKCMSSVMAFTRNDGVPLEDVIPKSTSHSLIIHRCFIECGIVAAGLTHLVDPDIGDIAIRMRNVQELTERIEKTLNMSLMSFVPVHGLSGNTSPGSSRKKVFSYNNLFKNLNLPVHAVDNNKTINTPIIKNGSMILTSSIDEKAELVKKINELTAQVKNLTNADDGIAVGVVDSKVEIDNLQPSIIAENFNETESLQSVQCDKLDSF